MHRKATPSTDFEFAAYEIDNKTQNNQPTKRNIRSKWCKLISASISAKFIVNCSEWGKFLINLLAFVFG